MTTHQAAAGNVGSNCSLADRLHMLAAVAPYAKLERALIHVYKIIQ